MRVCIAIVTVFRKLSIFWYDISKLFKAWKKHLEIEILNVTYKTYIDIYVYCTRLDNLHLLHKISQSIRNSSTSKISTGKRQLEWHVYEFEYKHHSEAHSEPSWTSTMKLSYIIYFCKTPLNKICWEYGSVKIRIFAYFMQWAPF